MERPTAEQMLDRGSLVVCVPVVESDARTLTSVLSVLEHSQHLARTLLVGPDAALADVRRKLSERLPQAQMTSLALDDTVPVEAGTRDVVTAGCNAGIAASASADVVLLSAEICVTAGWLDGLRAAALSDSTVATATPLCLGTGAVDLFPDGAPDGLLLRDAAALLAQKSLKLYPKIVAVGPGCVYLCRPALELAGPLDEDLGIEDALLEFGVRVASMGMVSVLADDVLVGGDAEVAVLEGTSPGVPQMRLADALVAKTVTDDEQGAVHRAVGWARAVLSPMSVTIDGRALVAAVGGTQTYMIELILALAREPLLTLRVLVPPVLSERAAAALASVPEVEWLTYEEAIGNPLLTDVVHRPQQVFTAADLALLRLVGRRVVIGQQDLIAYHNPSYHADIDSWRTYRRTTRLALAGADQAVFFSDHARRDALAEDLLPADRTHVVGLGAEVLEPADEAVERPDAVPDVPFLLCLGADYAHKNRPFAIELLAALRGIGWEGGLVFAGAHVPHGSSDAQELRVLRTHSELGPVIVDLGPIGESQRRWLFANARALLYPTLYEGFGLIPLEASHAGLPCLFAAQASLLEVAGEAATLVPWDAGASAAAVLSLLSDGPARERHLERLRSLATPSWRAIAMRLLTVYRQAMAAPPSEAAPHVWQELDRERFIVSLDEDIKKLKDIAEDYQVAYNALEARVSTGLPLIDEGGLLTGDQQRGLMRVASRRIGAILLRPLALLGRLERRAG